MSASTPPPSGAPAPRDSELPSSLPSPWLDRLLVAACELPVSEGEEAVVSTLLHTLSEILPDVALGARYTVLGQRKEREQRMLKLTPKGQEKRGAFSPGSRLFLGYEHERVFPLHNLMSTTLHVATEDPEVLEDASAVVHLARRASVALERGILTARKHSAALRAARELQEVTAHLVQAEKLASLGQLAAGIVHELNNPLTSIVAYSALMARRRDAFDADDQLRLARIQESADRMLSFTKELMTYARPSSERTARVDLHLVLERALSFCEHLLAETGVTVERRYVAELPPVYGRTEQLVQVFVNLFTNACHAMEQGQGRLLVFTQSRGERLLVVVEDNGHGVEEAHLAKIFTPFFSTKGEGRGTGLGLSIVKNIVEAHGGAIRAEQRDDSSRGARFLMELPAAVGEQGPSSEG